MATKTPGRARIFTGETLRRRGLPLQVEPAAALVALGGVVYDWDLASDALSWGPNASATLGLRPHELPATGSGFHERVEPRSGRTRHEALALGETRYDLRYVLRLDDGRAISVQDAGRLISGADDRPGIVRGCLSTDPRGQNQESLPRSVQARSVLLGRLRTDIAEALRFSHGLTLVVCEIAGDELPDIADIMRLARPMLRIRDYIAPLSATRFAILLASCAVTDAPAATRKLSALLAADGRDVRLAAASAPSHGLEPCRLLRLAEQALSVSPAGSATTICDPHAVAGSRRLRPAAEPIDVVRALNERDVGLSLRAIVDAHNLMPTMARVETLVSGAPFHQLSPDAETALLVDARRLELAAEHLAAHSDARIVLPIAAATLRNTEWLSVLAAHLGARPGVASRMIVALPEAVLVEKTKVLGRLDAMKALGIGLSLDGFGRGHATCARLRNLPVDLVTVDGIFIQNLGRSTGDRLFVRTLVDIAQHLGIATAAEWVDDSATAVMLGGWGVDYLQGALFGRSPVREAHKLARRA